MPPKGNIANLKPQNTRSKEEQREVARMGGVASGKVRREKKLFEQKYAAYFGKKDLTEVFDALVSRKDSATVALLKEARETVDGSKMELSGDVDNPLVINIVGIKPKE